MAKTITVTRKISSEGSRLMASRRKVDPSRYDFAPKTKKAIKKIARREINKRAEHKYSDTIFSAVTIPNTGYIRDLCAIAQQTTTANDFTRAGDKIMPLSLELRLDFSYNSSSIYNTIRIVLLRWKIMDDTHGEAPTPALILQYTVGGNQTPESPLIHDLREQFAVIYDKSMVLGAGSANHKLLVKKFKLAARQINYFAATVEGQYKYYLLLASNEPTNYPSVNGYIRINFTDS